MNSIRLERVGYFKTSEYFCGRKKKNLYEQNFRETSKVRLTGRVLQKLSLYANQSCDEHAVVSVDD